MVNNLVNSVYIHIPFCSNICSYCDFCKFYYNEPLVSKYIDGLLSEIKTRYKLDIIDTIYIGGGTPSSLNLAQLEKLLANISILFKTSSNLEYTIECNILDITEEKLEMFKKYGINRLSIGVESFNEKILKFLDRNYTKIDIINKIKLAKKYFSNINIDLIYAIPFETIDILKEDLSNFIKLDINHISTYSLMIEDHTKLKIKNTKPIDEQLDYDMYKLISDTLKKEGFIHYEISNFSKEGFESKHNLTYWMNKKYYGFGLNASGYIDNIRYSNTKNISKYLNGEYIFEKEVISRELDISNEVILGFRTVYGINKKRFLNKFNINFSDYFDIKELLKDNIIIDNGDNFYINPDKWYIENEILVKFI